MDPPGVSFQTGQDQSGNDRIRISSANNQMRSSAPGSAPIVDVGLYPLASAPNGGDVLNRGQDNENFGCVLHTSSAQPLSQ